jgi:hypothetical protein
MAAYRFASVSVTIQLCHCLGTLEFAFQSISPLEEPALSAFASVHLSTPALDSENRNTCRAILRQFGLKMSLNDFMGAMHRELAGFASAV